MSVITPTSNFAESTKTQRREACSATTASTRAADIGKQFEDELKVFKSIFKAVKDAGGFSYFNQLIKNGRASAPKDLADGFKLKTNNLYDDEVLLEYEKKASKARTCLRIKADRAEIEARSGNIGFDRGIKSISVSHSPISDSIRNNTYRYCKNSTEALPDMDLQENDFKQPNIWLEETANNDARTVQASVIGESFLREGSPPELPLWQKN